MIWSEKNDGWAFVPELMNDKELSSRYQSLAERAERIFREEIRKENGLVGLLEQIVSEPDWREIRAWLTLLETYADWFDLENKRLILQYLYELLFHDNGAIRRLSAYGMGYILSSCVEEEPEMISKIYHRILFQSGKKTEFKRRWIGYNLKTLISTMFDLLEDPGRKEVLRAYTSYFKSYRWGRLSCLNLLEGIMDIPWNSFSAMERGYIFDFLRNFLKDGDEELREAALWLIDSWLSAGWYCPDDVKSYLFHLEVPEEARTCEHYLIKKIQLIIASKNLDIMKKDLVTVMEDMSIDYEVLFHENLQSDHYWIYKMINLDILKQHFAGGDENDLFLYATHLVNMLRLNTQQEVFRRVGEDLVEIFPSILQHQRYEVLREMFKAIELRDDSSNYIPEFLGRTFPLLDKKRQKDLLISIRELSDSKNTDTVKIIAETIAIIIQSMSEIAEDNPGERTYIGGQRRLFLGILCRCMAGYKEDVAIETFYIVGNILMKNPERIGWPAATFREFARKILTYMRDTPACHGRIYLLKGIHRIAGYLERLSAMEETGDRKNQAKEDKKKVAIFSGSFDPFTMSQRAVVLEAAESGFMVYVNVHNFDWAKNTQPLMIRRRIAAITIADIPNALLLPVECPINKNQPDDLKKLARIFEGQEVYLIVGSNEAGVSEAYMKEPEEWSIHQFPHIIFSRNESYGYPDMRKIRRRIKGDIVYLNFPGYYENMSSQEIRQSLEEGKDMEGLVDIQVQHMIKDWNLYTRTSLYKQVAAMNPLEDRVDWSGDHLSLTITSGGEENEYACSRCHEEDPETIVIDSLYMHTANVRLEFLLQEVLSICQEKSYKKAVVDNPHMDKEILVRAGFVKVGDHRYQVDLGRPLVLFFDADALMKKSYSREPAVQEALLSGRNRLQEALTKLYPGELILNIDSKVLNYKMNRLIRQSIEMPRKDPEDPAGERQEEVRKQEEAFLKNDLAGEGEDREAGPEERGESFANKMCVPFGKILKGIRIPNIVTKVLNAEKVYDQELRNFGFRELPDYPSLPIQIRTIHSFGMPVILVDDVYHKGYRMERMGQLLDTENVSVTSVIVGVMSGQGKELAEKTGRKVEGVYFVPNMKAWLLESDMYPFIGGDGILGDSTERQKRNASPSINTLLPYQLPSFLKDAQGNSLHDLSVVCLENVRDIFLALEQVYRDRYHRTLTFERIKEVFREPRYPDGIDLSDRTMKRPVSEILTGELHRLARLNRHHG